MDLKNYKEICSIISDLQIEFSTEEDNLLNITKEHTCRIDELEQQIITCRKNEDIDYRVFSPRNIANDHSEKIKVLENEKHTLEKEKREAEKKVGYYSNKSERLARVLYLLKSLIDEEDDSDLKEAISSDNSLSEDNLDSFLKIRKKEDPFSFIEDDTDKNEESDNNSDVVDTSDRSDNVDKISESVTNDAEINIAEDTDIDSNDNITSEVIAGVPISEVERVRHKVKFSEKIINNDRIRARLELKEVISQLDELIIQYGNKE